jgi:hypothetical protein
MVFNQANNVAVALVGVDQGLVADLRMEAIATTDCCDLPCAIKAVREGACDLMVVSQPQSWSLHRTAGELTSEIGDGVAILLSPDGAAFAPGLFVVDQKITGVRLASLIKRVAVQAPKFRYTCS